MEDPVLNLVTKIILGTATRADFLAVSTEISDIYEDLENYINVFTSFSIIFVGAPGKDAIRLDVPQEQHFKYQVFYEYPDNVGNMVIRHNGELLA